MGRVEGEGGWGGWIGRVVGNGESELERHREGLTKRLTFPFSTCSHSHMLTPSLAHTPTYSHSHMLTPSHAHTPTCSHPHMFTLPHAHTPTCLHPHMLTLPHAHTPTCSHPHMLTPSHAHTLTCSPPHAHTPTCSHSHMHTSTQVSHHPPMFAMHAEHKEWTLWQEYTVASKFRGKYLVCYPIGSCHLMFHRSKSHYTWCKVATTIHNIIVGKLWVDQVRREEFRGDVM